MTLRTSTTSAYGSLDEGRAERAANVNPRERVVSAALGGTILVLALRPGLLGKAALGLIGGGLLYRGATGHCHVYETLGMDSSDRESLEPGASAAAKEAERSITIGRPADELHRFWRDPQNLSQIMGHFADITATDDERQRWTVRAPLVRGLEWTSRIVEDRVGEFLRWESVGQAELPNEGSLRFRPASGGRGTEVTLRVRFDPPGGRLGNAVMKRLGMVPTLLVQKALNRFKSLVETGEIPTLEKNSSARSRGTANHP